MMRNIRRSHRRPGACLGATPISIYNSSSPEQVAYLTGPLRATVAVVEDTGFLEPASEGPRRAAGARAPRRPQRPPTAWPDPDVHTVADLLESEPIDLDASGRRPPSRITWPP